MKSETVLLSILGLGPAWGFTPYTPTVGWTYYLEGSREGEWPDCAYRFLSHDSSCSTVDLWKGAGGNQEWTLEDAGGGGFYLRSNCGKYLSYAGDCSNHVLDMWADAGVNQKFLFTKGDNDDFTWYLEAAGRAGCDYRWGSFPVGCTTTEPDTVDLWSAAGTDQQFRIHPVRNKDHPLIHSMNSNFLCADPFMWWSDESSHYKLQCTGENLGLASTPPPLSAASTFTYSGSCLGGSPPAWASANNRWAPENFEHDGLNYIFFSDSQPDGSHRIGWAASGSGANPSAYDRYSSGYMNLGEAAGGDIDQHIFADDNGLVYIVWKTDDNNVGSTYTRIFAQEISVGNYSVSQIGSPREIMDSTGLWWVDSWVSGGSLVEGPDIVKHNGFYYLFFASGKYCEDSYAEGVAKSKNFWGPYDKMKVPILSSGIVGNSASNGGKLVGPGHASIARNHNDIDDFWIVYHASVGENCDRYPFINQLEFTQSGKWPYVDF